MALEHKLLLGIVLFAVVISIFSIDEAYAEPRPITVLKIQGTFPVDVAFFDQPLPFAVQDVNKTLVFVSYSHTGDSDQADTSRAYELIDDSTLRIWGSTEGTGNIAQMFVAYVIEIQEEEFAFNVERNEFLIQNGDLTGTVLQNLDTPVNASRAFEVFSGLYQAGSDTSWGQEEFGQLFIDSSTQVGFVNEVTDTADAHNLYQIVSFNNSTTDSFVQRGSGTISFGSTTANISPPIDVNRDSTLVLVTWNNDQTFDIGADHALIRVHLDNSSPPNILLERDSGNEDPDSTIDYSWVAISFDPTIAKVHHEQASLAGGVLTLADTLTTPVLDMDKAFVISGASSPYGQGTGEATSTDAGAFDRGMARIFLSDQDEVTITRQDSTGTSNWDYQVIEFLEETVPEEATGENNRFLVRQLQGTFAAGDTTEDFMIVPPLLNLNKTISFVTFSVDFSTTDGQGASKSWEIIDENTLRIQGNHDQTITNPEMPFTAVIIEYDVASPILVQRDIFTYLGGMSVGEKIMKMSPVNITNTMILKDGRHLTGGDNTYGMEEYDRVRLLTNTTWGYDVEAFQDIGAVSGTTTTFVEIVDWNDDRVGVQQGQVTLSGGSTTVTVSPPIDIIQNRTMLFFSYQTATGDFDDHLSNLGLLGTITTDSPPDLIFQRDGTTGGLEINWQTVSIPNRMGIVQHFIHNMTSGTGNNTHLIPNALFNASEAFAVSTTNQHSGFGFGKSDSTVVSKIDHAHVQVSLENTTHVRFERADTTGSLDSGIQVVSLEDTMCERCVVEEGDKLETNSTTGDPIPACCNDGPSANPDASFTIEQISVLHQLIEWYEPTNAPLELMIDDIENGGKSLFQIILRMTNGTYGSDQNLTDGGIFYQDRYLVRANLTDFINNIIPDVRTEFGAPT